VFYTLCVSTVMVRVASDNKNWTHFFDSSSCARTHIQYVYVYVLKRS